MAERHAHRGERAEAYRRVLHGIARKCNTRASGALADDALHPLRVSVRRSHLCRHVACHLAQQINARLHARTVLRNRRHAILS